MTLTLTPLPDFPLISPGDDLASIILASLEYAAIDLRDGDILVLAQKIVSKAEDRLVNLSDVEVSSEARKLAQTTQKDPRLVELILGESRTVIRSRPNLIIVEHKLGFICANAGIDHSNVNGEEDWVLLLPEDPDSSAQSLRAKLESQAGCTLGLLIIDSHGRAWRAGTLGITIGLSGVPGVVDLRGQLDLFGYELQATDVGAADELAAAASLVMGQAAEASPVVHARGFPYTLRKSTLKEILRPTELDLFR